MQKLHVQLTRPLSSVDSNHQISFVAISPDDTFGKEPPKPNAILEVAKSIQSQLAKIQQTIAQQQSQVQTAATTYSIEMLRMLLQKDDELMTARVQRYIDLALAESATEDIPTVYVHPFYLESITEYLSKAEANQCVIESDPGLPKTDCRVEFNDNGLIASLDHQMNLVVNRLTQAIADGVLS